MQNNNPIYVGSGPQPVYEPVPGESMKHLLSPDGTPTTTQADYVIHYRFDSDPVPSLPPLRKASTKQLNLKLEDDKVDLTLQQTELPSAVLGDEHMVMNKSLPPKDTKTTNSTSVTVSDNIN